MSVLKITVEEFLRNPNVHLDAMKPGDWIKIGDCALLIHPQDLRYLEKCAESVDAIEVEESLCKHNEPIPPSIW